MLLVLRRQKSTPIWAHSSVGAEICKAYATHRGYNGCFETYTQHMLIEVLKYLTLTLLIQTLA